MKPVRRSKETVPEAEPVVTEAAKEETGAWSWIKDVNRENAGERLAEAEARIQELDEEMNSAFEIDDIEAIQKEQLILNAWTDAIRTAIRTGIDYNFPKLDDYKQKAGITDVESKRVPKSEPAKPAVDIDKIRSRYRGERFRAGGSGDADRES